MDELVWIFLVILSFSNTAAWYVMGFIRIDQKHLRRLHDIQEEYIERRFKLISDFLYRRP